jgi:hypothetical protein
VEIRKGESEKGISTYSSAGLNPKRGKSEKGNPNPKREGSPYNQACHAIEFFANSIPGCAASAGPSPARTPLARQTNYDAHLGYSRGNERSYGPERRGQRERTNNRSAAARSAKLMAAKLIGEPPLFEFPLFQILVSLPFSDSSYS